MCAKSKVLRSRHQTVVVNSFNPQEFREIPTLYIIPNIAMRISTNAIIGFLAFASYYAPLFAQPPRPPRPSGPDCVVKKDEIVNGQGIPVNLNGDASWKASSGRPDRVRLTDDAMRMSRLAGER